MPISVRTFFLPDHVTPGQLAGSTAVVVDILRATTCIVQALASGAAQVIPVLDVNEARRVAELTPNSLLVGERHGLALPGFDLGNSPAEFTPAVVAGRTLVMTTTNGTKALLCCREAEQILIGSFLNLSRLTRLLTHTSNPLCLVCAGTDGQVTREDLLFAGGVVSRLREANPANWEFDEASVAAEAEWLATSIHTSCELAQQFADSQGGRNLIAIGHGNDLELAAAWDSAPIVPRFDPLQGSVRCLLESQR